MRRLTIANSVYFEATVSLLEYAREIGIDWDKAETFVPMIGRLRYVSEVEERHQFWARLSLETWKPDVAAKRTADVLAKIERILRRYAKEA